MSPISRPDTVALCAFVNKEKKEQNFHLTCYPVPGAPPEKAFCHHSYHRERNKKKGKRHFRKIKVIKIKEKEIN